jgi:undecaprenyl-diphosphatase
MIEKLSEFDNKLTSHLRMNPEMKGWWQISAFLAHSGDSWFWLLALVIIWFNSNTEWHDRSAIMAVGIFGLALLVFAIKLITRRRRPEGEWGGIYRRTDPHSFPSGHAARATLLAVLAFGLGPPWFALLLAIWAPLVCLARVFMSLHYLSDVVAGMVLGFAAGLVVLQIQPLIRVLLPFLF